MHYRGVVIGRLANELLPQYQGYDAVRYLEQT